MANAAQQRSHGYQCPVRGCDKKHNRRFSARSLATHISDYHGEEELIKRLRAKIVPRKHKVKY